MASNYVVGLIDVAVMLMGAASIDRPAALEALRPLTLASAINALTLGPAEALTGPIARGDLETVAAHLEALAQGDASIEKLYRAIGLHLAKCAGRIGKKWRGCSMAERARRVRVPDLKEMKKRGEKIAMLTAYDAVMAQLLDEAGLDVLLVGDSLGMVLLGYETTLPVTLDDMVHHTRAVTRGATRALVVADMPFLTYQVSVEEAVRNAGRLLQEGGAHASRSRAGGPFSTRRDA